MEWSTLSGVDSRGAGGATAPPEFGGSEKRTEREIHSTDKSNPEFEKLLSMALYRKQHLHVPKESKKVDFWGQAVLVGLVVNCQKSCHMNTLESGIDVGPWISVGHEQNVQIYVTKNPLILKISVDPCKNSKIY